MKRGEDDFDRRMPLEKVQTNPNGMPAQSEG